MKKGEFIFRLYLHIVIKIYNIKAYRMVKYECKICQFENINKNKYQRHILTKKHLEKVAKSVNIEKGEILYTQSIPKVYPKYTEKRTKCIKKRIFLCDFCNNEFSGASSLGRHKKACSLKYTLDNNHAGKIKEIENTCDAKIEKTLTNAQLTEMQNKINFLERECAHYKDEATTYKYIVSESGDLVKKSMSSLAYLIKNCSTAPPLEMIDGDIINHRQIVYDENTKKAVMEEINSDESIDEEKLASDIISAYKHKTLNKYLGNCIIDTYKKDEKSTQSIWNTDTSRLTYIIRDLINNKTPTWYVDKKGVKTQTFLIDPLLLNVKEIIMQYQIEKNAKLFEYKGAELELVMENISAITHLVTEIDDGTTAVDLLKYLAPYLKINTHLLE